MRKTRISNTKADTKTIVGRSFIRVVKNHQYYHIFKSRFDNMAKLRKGERSPFSPYEDFDTLMAKIEEFTVAQNSHPKDKYEHITMMINHMLHFFLEQGGVDPRRLGMYGQEIFDIACYALFGDEYLKDMDKMNHSAPRPKNDLEAYLVGEFMKLKNHGHDISWEDFIVKFARQIDRSQFNERNYNDHRVNPDEDYGYDDEYDDDGNGDYPF
jgi:hypothetical protein